MGGEVYLAFTTNTSLNGVYTIASEPDSTHFTVTTANPAGASGLSDTVYIPHFRRLPNGDFHLDQLVDAHKSEYGSAARKPFLPDIDDPYF